MANILKKHAGTMIVTYLVLSAIFSIFVTHKDSALVKLVFVAVWFFIAGRPALQEFLASRHALAKPEEPVTTAEYLRQEAAAKQAADDMRPKVTEETALYRAKLTADIRACIDSQGKMQWAWPNTTSVDYVTVSEDGKPDVYHGILRIIDNHVYSVLLEKLDGTPVMDLPNKAYVQKISEPLNEFFRTSLPDACWTWYGPSRIVLTSPKKGMESILCTVNTAADGHVTSLMYMVCGQKRYICRRAQKAPTHAASAKKVSASSSAEPIQESPTSTKKVTSTEKKAPGVKNATRINEFVSVITASEEAAEKQPVECGIDDDLAQYALKPTDDPPISDDCARSNAGTVFAAINADISNEAASAEEAGETEFSIDWPKGIQTLREAEFLAEQIMNSGCFASAAVDASTKTIRIEIIE